MTYNKAEFAELLRKKGYTKKDALTVIDDFVDALKEVLLSGDEITFTGFGNFKVKHRAAPDPTQTIIPHKCSAYVKFSQSPQFRQILKERTGGGGAE